ncbi:uncharacterized protein E6C27_scaffold36G001630 [Cucumis melo var. makuwa]|uniref:Uncharacterized protein n=1 Tax=Cucumis melo var. makuwa TaxID=1194695 RepID=A0A5A7T8Q1_CUCMM|nr:uncharacterized protein E6C27_scaffold36G001630 [Cucumis melo var. makuwa]
MPFVPIDGLSFHSEESVLDLIEKARMVCTVTNLAVLTGSVAVLRTPVQLVLELSSGLIQTWLIDEQLLVTKLSVKNAILHKIGIANWGVHLSANCSTCGHLWDQHYYMIPSVNYWIPPFSTFGGSSSSRAELLSPAAGLHLPRELAVGVVELLFDESHALSVSIEEV